MVDDKNLQKNKTISNTDPEPITAIVPPAFKSEIKPTEVTPKAEPEPAKEVKKVAEVKDPAGKFDYTGCESYVVKEGESLFDVAQKYVVALQQLRYFNHINKATLHVRPGQTLYIPKKPVYVPAGE